MKDSDIESIFKQNVGESVVAALRVIYNLGYCDGASITPSITTGDKSAAATKPSDSSIQVLSTQSKGKVK
jgi:hypothetical protein